MFSSLLVVRMLVSFLVVVGLTAMSLSRAFSATTWPRRSVSRSTARICATTGMPSTVVITGFLLRSKSTTSSSSSSFWICILRPDWLTRQRSAACRKLWVSSTATA